MEMEYLRIQGGHRLKGTVTLPGAKNSLLPILAAGILCNKPVTIHNVPTLTDLDASLQILRAVGWGAEYMDGTVQLFPAMHMHSTIPEKAAGAMRSSVFYMAPLLHRTGKVELPSPGGCRLGQRPIDIHLEGLVKMGACAKMEGDILVLRAENGLKGTNFRLRYPSVGATETLMMAAVLAKGESKFFNVAKEPEVVDLANFLNTCGAEIQGMGTDCLEITGVERLEGAVHTLIPDRIVAATLLAAVVCAGGEVCMNNVCPVHLAGVLDVFRRMGVKIWQTEPGQLKAQMYRRPLPLGAVKTGPFPKFCTDAAPLVAAALLTSTGRTTIEDTVFENRFDCAMEFSKMGACALKQGRSVRIWGKEEYAGGKVHAADLRGGAALVCAALAAKGESKIFGLEYINRGYSDLQRLLSDLGADISLQSTEVEKISLYQKIAKAE